MEEEGGGVKPHVEWGRKAIAFDGLCWSEFRCQWVEWAVSCQWLLIGSAG